MAIGWVILAGACALIAAATWWCGGASRYQVQDAPPPATLRPLHVALGIGAIAACTGVTVLAVSGRRPVLALALWLLSLTAASAAVRGWIVTPAFRARTRWTPAEVAAVVGLLIVAAALRTIWLDAVPPYYFGDEPRVGIFLLNRYAREIPNFFSLGWNTWPVLALSVQGLFAPFVGLQVHALRLSSALVGTLAVLATYLLARELLTVRVALVAAFLLAVGRTGLDFSRLGICHAQVILLETAAFACWWRAVNRGRASAYLWCGILLALCLYTYNAGHLAPFLWGAGVVLCAAGAPRLVRSHWKGVAIAGFGFLLTFAPLLLVVTDQFTWGANWREWTYMARNRQTLSAILDAWHAHGASSAAALLWEQASRTWLGFTVLPATAYQLGYRGGGMLDQVTGPLFVLGLAIALVQVIRPRYGFLCFCWLVTTVIGGVLTQNPPAFVRLVGLLPFLAILAALPLEWLLRASAGGGFRTASAMALLGLLLAAATADNCYTYFVRFPRDTFDPVSELAHYVQRLPRDAAVLLLGPEHYLNFTHEEIFGLEFRERSLTEVPEVAQLLPIHRPTTRPVGLILGPTQVSLSSYITSLYPSAVAADVIRGERRELVFRTVEVSAEALHAQTGLALRLAGDGTPTVADPFSYALSAPGDRAVWSGVVYWPTSKRVAVQAEGTNPSTVTIGGQRIAVAPPGTTEAAVEVARGWQPITIDEQVGNSPRRFGIRIVGDREPVELTRWDVWPNAGGVAPGITPGLAQGPAPAGLAQGLEAEYSRNGAVIERTIEPQVDLFAVETFFNRAQLGLRCPFAVTLRGLLLVERDGVYQLQTNASGRHRVLVDGDVLFDVPPPRPEEPQVTGVERPLTAGPHRIEVAYECERLPDTTRRIFQLLWAPPDGQPGLIPPTRFAHAVSPVTPVAARQ